jgi:hypothetical protein
MHKPGIRVGAISHTEDGVVYFFGYGVYEGDFPREGPGLYGMDAENQRKEAEDWVRKNAPEMTEEQVKEFGLLDITNPRIRLDNGKTVWRCQCWWGPEDEIKKYIENNRVVPIDIDEQIQQHKRKEN